MRGAVGSVHVLTALLACVLALAAYYGERINNARHAAEVRAEVQRQLAMARNRLEGNLYSDLQLARGLVSVVTLEPGLDQARFELAARPLLSGQTRLRNIGAAPDMVIRLMYPLRGNERALGLDYRRHPQQSAAAEQARLTRRIVLAGPIDLVQGGRGLAARLPVYLPGAAGTERFWGLLSAVIDADALFRDSGLLDPSLPIDIAMRGKDAQGAAGAVFFGRPELFDAAAVQADIQLPSGAWRLAAAPRGGWPARADNVWTLRLGFALLALVVLGAFQAIGRAWRDASSASERAESARRQLSATLEHAPNVAVQWYDAQGRVVYWNPASERLYGWTAGEALGKTLDRLIHTPEESLAFAETLRRVAAGGEPVGPAESLTHDRAGEARWVAATLFPIPGRARDEVIFVRMLVDITERKRAEAELTEYRDHLEDLVVARTRELAAAKEAAESASVAKSAFLANMSHEIRTPLGAITGMAHLIRRDGLTPAQAGRLDKLEAAGAHLLEVINAILDLSKIEAGKFDLAETEIQVEAMLNNIASILHERITAKGLRLDIRVASLPPRLLGDPTRLQQALLNYAGNAVKFTDRGGITLDVGLEEEDSDSALLRFEVRDTGIGVDPRTLPRLFAAFEQADSGNTRKYGGTGLGLTITRRIARLMGGEAGATSTPGQGSCFWFTARLKKGAPGAPAPRAVPGGDAEAVLRRDYPGGQVLVVEDEPVNQEIALLHLDDIGQFADLAEDGEVAVRMARVKAYDLILLDMEMPRMDGVEAARRIRALPGHADTPIVAVTANAFAEDRQRCLAAGMNDFLAKPYTPEALFAVLLKWYARRAG